MEDTRSTTVAAATAQQTEAAQPQQTAQPAATVATGEAAAQEKTIIGDNPAAQNVESGTATILGENKPEEGKAGETPSKPAPLTREQVKFQDKLAMSDTHAEEFIALANEVGLTVEQAQKLADYAAKSNITLKKEINEKAKKSLADMSRRWREESKARFANNWDETVNSAKEAYGMFATPEFRNIVEVSGLGNNPEFLAVFAAIGRKMRSDRVSNSSIPNGNTVPAKREFSSWYRNK